MGRRLEDLLHDAMELTDEDRLRLAEKLVASVEPDEKWWAAWTAESTGRQARMESGEDRELTLAEFWSDED